MKEDNGRKHADNLASLYQMQREETLRLYHQVTWQINPSHRYVLAMKENNGRNGT